MRSIAKAPNELSETVSADSASPLVNLQKENVDGEVEEVEIDIPEDAYGAGILAIVRDIVVIRTGSWSDERVKLSIVQTSFALLLLVLNLVMQFALLYFIYLYVVGPSVNHVQRQYAHFHRTVFDADGAFLADVWEDYPHKSDVCQIGMSNPWFYWLVVLLWVLLIIREFRTTERLMGDICFQIPSCTDMTQMCKEGGPKVQIVALTFFTRSLLLFIIIIPKFLICGTLMWLGCQWLSATTSFTDLVMNSIAMDFVTHIDENLYDSILPSAHREQVAAINFVVYRKTSSSRSSEFSAFQRSFLYLMVAIGFVFTYGDYIQTVLPANVQDLKHLCEVYSSSKNDFSCDAPWWMGTHGTEGCFPYGEH